jgi:hypothetical protein
MLVPLKGRISIRLSFVENLRYQQKELGMVKGILKGVIPTPSNPYIGFIYSMDK